MQLSPLGFLIVVNILFLSLVLDTLLMLLVIVPIILPSLAIFGIDPVHFGVVIVVNMMIAWTPPFGMLLFVINALAAPLKA
jgi:TRAP-type C4-dicarboxylate transport system permease large subunit